VLALVVQGDAVNCNTNQCVARQCQVC